MIEWIEKLRSGETRVLARALTEIENREPDSRRLLEELFPYSGKARRIGITGAPGVGKSTLVDKLVGVLREQGRSVGIVAVDPSSPFTGGSILGDRVRMPEHQEDPGVFIRSMATRGALGGLALATSDVMMALDASGRDVILVETAGVGQAEIDIVKLATTVALVLTPSMGDDVQIIKAGVMEIADTFVINKADHPGTDRIEAQLRNLTSLPQQANVRTKIVRTVATTGKGIEDLLVALESCPIPPDRESNIWKERLMEMIREQTVENIIERKLPEKELADVARAVANRQTNPYTFVKNVK